jgi:hypothetical protein
VATIGMRSGDFSDPLKQRNFAIVDPNNNSTPFRWILFSIAGRRCQVCQESGIVRNGGKRPSGRVASYRPFQGVPGLKFTRFPATYTL